MNNEKTSDEIAAELDAELDQELRDATGGLSLGKETEDGLGEHDAVHGLGTDDENEGIQ